MSRIEWHPISGTPDYMSADGRFIAKYDRTIRGYGSYLTFRSEGASRKRSDAICVGGLPDWDRWEDLPLRTCACGELTGDCSCQFYGESK